ncbi:uncharacterized protein KY384_003596 [Bacidia gigantensis]|uniref:uncharacterized protein n=1 Tax=Bacidia gigantensis TaxID=2732470 RepID=UPI001D04D983|nr:uncharacterized protein KY384_003596 [Bacidia gigantensis]KAG8531960.1 hypothetical protein KY384_003596 [Bacidia gigantensis]
MAKRPSLSKIVSSNNKLVTDEDHVICAKAGRITFSHEFNGISPLFSLLQLDIYFPIASRICDFLPIVDIIQLTRTCKALSSLYRDLIPHKWNIDRFLSRHLKDPKAFRSMLGQCDALLSGESILDFYLSRPWTDANLCIYVERGDNTRKMMKYLRTMEEGSLTCLSSIDRQNGLTVRGLYAD